jgi:hypothetical protein
VSLNHCADAGVPSNNAANNSDAVMILPNTCSPSISS